MPVVNSSACFIWVIDCTNRYRLLVYRKRSALDENFNEVSKRALDFYVGQLERLKQAGVPVVRQPTEVASLKLTYAMVRDPDGYLIEFIQTN